MLILEQHSKVKRLHILYTIIKLFDNISNSSLQI